MDRNGMLETWTRSTSVSGILIRFTTWSEGIGRLGELIVIQRTFVSKLTFRNYSYDDVNVK